MTTIVIQTFLTGIIPNDLKIALATPVVKESFEEEFSNYGSISGFQSQQDSREGYFIRGYLNIRRNTTGYFKVNIVFEKSVLQT